MFERTFAVSILEITNNEDSYWKKRGFKHYYASELCIAESIFHKEAYYEIY